MIWKQLFDQRRSDTPVRAGVIGSGEFGTAIITQSRHVSGLEVPVVADVDLQAARRALRHAGFAGEEVVVAESHRAALGAIEQGKPVILQDPLLMMELPLDVIVESTGAPEAGALHALQAIEHNKHVLMVTKETDVTVGPILKRLADRAGVVYSAVEGDQHGLLIGLVEWARELGLDVLCGGKFHANELILDPASRTIARGGRSITFTSDSVSIFDPLPSGIGADVVQRRRAILGPLGRSSNADLDEMTIAANATGLGPDVPSLHGPALHLVEIADVLCSEDHGGILGQSGVIDAVISLCGPHQASLGGGVFIVVGVTDPYARTIMAAKGVLANNRGSAFLIYRPYHLCGVETPISILSAGLLQFPTGAREYVPRFDVVLRTIADLPAGDRLGGKLSGSKLETLILPTQPMVDGAPLPRHMANGCVLKADVLAGTIIKADHVIPSADSSLWSLRAQQDREFLSHARC